MLALALFVSCSSDDKSEKTKVTKKTEKSDKKEITIYSGRSLEYYEDVVEDFEKKSGITVNVREGDSAELASQLITEGKKTKADAFFAQDAGSLDAVSSKGLFSDINEATLEKVDAKFRSKDKTWVGISARVRVLAYNTKVFDDENSSNIPQTLDEIVDPQFKGKIAFAPTNGSFQSFVTGLRLEKGEKYAKDWLEKFKANEPKAYEKNSAIVKAINKGEINLGLVNNYYIYEVANELGIDKLNVANKYYKNSVASMLNVAGIGVLDSTKKDKEVNQFIDFLLNKKSQTHFAQTIGEYPATDEVKAMKEIPTLKELNPPSIDLSDLASIDKTLDLLSEVGLLTK